MTERTQPARSVEPFGSKGPDAVVEPGAADAVPFDDAITVCEREEGVYTADVHPSWDGPLTTHGGVLAACLLRAIDLRVNPASDLQWRTLTCHYMRPPAHGEIEIIVTPLRNGKRFANTAARIEQNGRLCVSALAIHSVRDLPEADHWDPAIPDVAPAPARGAATRNVFEYYDDPGDCWIELPSQAPRFFHRMKVAPRFGTFGMMGPRPEPGEGTENGGWLTLPQPRPVDPALLTLFVDAFWPTVFQPLRVAAMAPTLDLTIHFREQLPPEGLPDQPLLAYNTAISHKGATADSDSRIFSADGRLLAQARQLQFVTPIVVD
ncbi:MAG: thioesterase family protein [Actinobacteria bacterium]|nr:thioesterase family protein [Actinomycetota bacterium]